MTTRTTIGHNLGTLKTRNLMRQKRYKQGRQNLLFII